MPEITTAQWWQPQEPNKIRSGVLSQDDRGWLLELDGAFEEIVFPERSDGGRPLPVPVKLPEDIPILLGSTPRGQFISLIDCQVFQGTPSMGPHRGSLKLRPRILVYDVHFTSPEDFRLTSLSSHYANLDAW